MRAYVALGILFLIGLVNYFDRLALGVLQVPIKEELHFSDSQLGLLTGLAFFIPYTLLAIPIARIADRSNRKYLLAAALTVWSSMTALISAADGFLLILFLRMGVAIGEATYLPTAYSLLSDYYPPEKRGRAIAIFVMSFPLGSMLGIAGAGALADRFGWRAAFVVLGGLGLVLVPTLLLLLREPPRGGSGADAAHEPTKSPPPLLDAMRLLWDRRAFRYVALAMGFQTYVATTVLSWSAPFYTRVHHLELSHVAVALGLLTGIGGACGSFLGGALGDRLGCRNQRWYLWVPAMACAVAALAGLGQYLVSNAMLSLVFAFATMIMISGFVPPVYAIAQSLVAPNMRALTSALLVMASALLGGAFGPSVTGILSDYFAHAYSAGPHSLRIAICLGFSFAIGAAWLFYKAGHELQAAPLEET
jgi:predicted MFS family arabinose efflux permease